MKKYLFLSVLFLFTASVQLAADTNIDKEKEIIFKAMSDEMTRSINNLKAKGMQKPYYIAYQVNWQNYFNVKTFMGEEIASSVSKGDVSVNVMMRIGSKQHDNSFFENTVISTVEEPLPSASYDSITKALWLRTDEVYKQALDQYTKKEAYFKKKNIKQEDPDFSQAEISSSLEDFSFKQFDKNYLIDLAKQMSEQGNVKELNRFYTNISFLQGPVFYLSSEGAKYVRDNSVLAIYLSAQADTPQGFPLSSSKTLVYKDIDELPSQQELIKIAKDFSLEMQAAVKSPKAEAYIGPVLLEGEAASYIFQKAFVKNAVKTKKVYSLSNEKDRYMGEFAQKKGLKIMPLDYDVSDEPDQQTFNGKKLLGYYSLDDEGVVPSKIQIITKGKLTGLPATRSSGQTNGHARASLYESTLHPQAFISNLFFRPEKTYNKKQLKVKFLQICRKENLDYCYTIRRFDNNNIIAYKIDAKTGEQTLVHGFEMPAISTRTLRDIVASGNDFTPYNFYTDSAPAYSIISPSIILKELELKPSQTENKKPPKLEKPEL